MALHGVFANDLKFGKGVSSEQAEYDESIEREQADIGDADLEEGEIADDDEDAQSGVPKPSEETAGEKSTNLESETKKEELKIGTDISSLKSGVSAEKRREKRAPSNSNQSRLRKRTHEDDPPNHREMHRKRRRTHDGDNVDDLEDTPDYEIMSQRGQSPMERLQRYSGGGESTGSDYEENVHMNSLRRQRDVRARPGRSTPPRRKALRGASRERGGSDRRRAERDRSDRDRRSTKNSPSSSHISNKLKDESICAFYMEGKCSRGNDCPYSHAALPPRKMELCKFYLMDCCAKKEKCLYLHKDFPCKFFHTGKKCRYSADDCKFSHEVLSETMRAILIKHIETAPREILGDFPRLTREETIQAIDNFSPFSTLREKRPHIPALFESSLSSNEAIKLDLKETVRNQPSINSTDDTKNVPSSTRRVAYYQETNIAMVETEQASKGEQPEENSRSIWFGHLRQEAGVERNSSRDKVDERPKDNAEDAHGPRSPPLDEQSNSIDYLSTLPARQRQLYRRIQQQQREPSSIQESIDSADEKNTTNEKWQYSSDEEENGKSISELLNTMQRETELTREKNNAAPALANLNLSSLENINVAEIAKALSTLQSNQSTSHSIGSDGGISMSSGELGRRDPRMRDPRVRGSGSSIAPSMSLTMNLGDVDLRVPATGRQDVDLRLDNRIPTDVDLRNGITPLGSVDEIGSSDVDLRRRFPLPFNPSTTYSPVQEIEATMATCLQKEYQVFIVDYVPLDYSLIRVQTEWAHLDPRQQKSITSTRDFTSSEPPAIPLGPASPDPINSATSTSISSRHHELEPAVYSPLRSGPNDPRARISRRGGGLQHSHVTQGLSDNRGSAGVGLLGPAPPGMLPMLSKGSAVDSTPLDPPYTNYRHASSSYSDRHITDEVLKEPQSRHSENHRDPRQRLKNPPTTVDTTERSYTPPINERVFR